MEFAYRLASHLHCRVEDLGGMAAPEWLGWLAYDRRSPVGPERGDYLAAMALAVAINLQSKRSVKSSDCLPGWHRKPAPKLTWQEVKAGFAPYRKRKEP